MSRRDYVAGESDSMDAILASDRFIEQLRTTGTFEPTSREDAALAFAMLDWRDEAREEPITPPPSVDDLDLSRLSKQPRRIAQRSVVVAGALLAMSSAAATAFDGDPLRPVRFLVDLGVTVGEGIGNPEGDDSSTDGVEPNPREIDSGEVAEEPVITAWPEDQGQPVPESNNTDGPKDPSSSDSTEDAGGDATDDAGESEGEPPESLPTQPQPTEDIEEDDSSGEDTSGEDTSGDGDETDLPPETSEPTTPTEPSDTPPDEPTDTPPTTPDSTTNGGDTDGGEGTDGENQDSDPEDPAEEPDAPLDPEQSSAPPDGDELGGIDPIEGDGSDHDGSGDDASHGPDSNGWDNHPDSNGWGKHPDSGWWGDRWPPSYDWSDWTSLTSWTDSHGAGHPAWRAGQR